jgi:hypothetical protein
LGVAYESYYPHKIIRYPLSVIRYPLSVGRYALTVLPYLFCLNLSYPLPHTDSRIYGSLIAFKLHTFKVSKSIF